MKLKFGKILAIAIVAVFWACSDESITEKTEYGTTNEGNVAESIKDLPDCEEENEGNLYWVSSEKQYRICKDEKWFGVMKSETSDEKTEISCKTEKLKKGSGYKVVCNGDSVGVLMNGIDAEPVEIDEDESLDCVIDEQVKDSLKLVCGSKEYVVPLDSTTLTDMLGVNLEDDEESIELDSEQIVTSLEDVSGHSQKGPFLLGSEVVAYELQNGRTLKQTGKQFHGKISDDKGSFNIRTVKITSQYAYLAAKGFYRNEVSGKVSGQQITLNALTDLSNRNIVNINVLSHLEYDRIVYLVTQKKNLVKTAKKKAEEEIFKIFHMDSLDIDGVSEDFSIGGSGVGDAALLAISALLQRNQTEAEMQAQITSMSEAIAKTGEWDNDSLKIAMADWASRMELKDSLKVIRANVEGWKLSQDSVAAFEPMIHNFWIQEYGIGECTKKRLGEVFAVDNKYSENDKSKSLVRLICVDSSDKKIGYTWRYATDLEKDTYGWSTDVEDGVVRSGALTDLKYTFNAEKKEWTFASEADLLFGGCTQEQFGNVKTAYGGNFENCELYNGLFYVCDESSHSWQLFSSREEADVYGWAPGENFQTRWSDTTIVTASSGIACYLYEESLKKWSRVSRNHCSMNLFIEPCNSSNAGKKVFSEKTSRLYECERVTTSTSRHCVDVEYSWIVRDEKHYANLYDGLYVNTNDLECNEDGWQKGRFNEDAYFVCDDGEWRTATVYEEIFGMPCFKQNPADDIVLDGKTYSCVNSEWVEKNE